MAELLTANSLERLMRACFATLAPITGARAVGEVRITAGATDVIVPANTYLLPVVRGELREDLVFKTIAEAPIAAGDTANVAITSNVGGARHNLAANTVFRFDPVLAGVGPTAVSIAGTSGGSNEGALLRSLAIYEDVDAENAEKDFFDANIGEYPAAILAWQQGEPTEGQTAGMSRGSSRARRQVSFTRESFVMYILVGRLRGDFHRRQEGIVASLAVARLLADRQQNDDGEQLSTAGGGVEIVERARLARGPTRYLYAVRFRTTQTQEGGAYSSRTFNAWEATRVQGALPGREPPEPTEPLTIVDSTEPMP